MFGGIVPGVSGDDDVVTNFQRVPCHALRPKLAGSTPLDGPSNQLSVVVFFACGQVEKRMRVAKYDLDEIPFDSHPLVGDVRGGKGMVREQRRDTCHGDSASHEHSDETFHDSPCEIVEDFDVAGILKQHEGPHQYSKSSIPRRERTTISGEGCRAEARH
jgi:hypothetical protein